ncbi:hypothetical protein JQX13_10865 [Archangium violaceum]|nr:hypothetical protein JQX13_10865 [Archangium violaceum]
MGQVFRARDDELQRVVALKFLLPREELAGMGLREARAIARLDHENIIRIFDMSEWSEAAPDPRRPAVGQSARGRAGLWHPAAVGDGTGRAGRALHPRGVGAGRAHRPCAHDGALAHLPRHWQPVAVGRAGDAGMGGPVHPALCGTCGPPRCGPGPWPSWAALERAWC